MLFGLGRSSATARIQERGDPYGMKSRYIGNGELNFKNSTPRRLLSYQDSNLDRQNQKLQCYHYTIRQSHAQG